MATAPGPGHDDPPAAARITLTLVVTVCGVWAAVGVVMGAQNALGSTLRGGTPIPLGTAISGALIQTLAWIPATIAAIALAFRFPLRADRWQRHAPVHLAGAVALAFVTNALVVLGYWVTSGQFGSLASLVRQGALWMTLRLHIALVIYAAVSALTHGMLYYRGARARELRLARVEGQLAVARLQALNAQIRPHFLFNTMHTIGQLWRSGRADDADAMLDRLGSLFHRVQATAGETEVPLADELDMVREYLTIEAARFPDRLRYTIDVPDEALTAPVPPLILQPLVENAVRHGVSRVSTAGRIRVVAELANGTLRLRVFDDGPGFGNAPGAPGSGTGLRNTRERLTELYGRAGTLEVQPVDTGGTLATISIPRPVSR
jgi:signal transduction histidine kinase